MSRSTHYIFLLYVQIIIIIHSTSKSYELHRFLKPEYNKTVWSGIFNVCNYLKLILVLREPLLNRKLFIVEE